MAEKQSIKEAVEFFYEDIIGQYKELEKRIVKESKLTSIFKKVDYGDRITRLKALKKKAQNLEPRKIAIDKTDETAVLLAAKLAKCIRGFCGVADTQVSINQILSQGRSADVKAYKKAAAQVQQAVDEMQRCLRDLDAVYAEL